LLPQRLSASLSDIFSAAPTWRQSNCVVLEVTLHSFVNAGHYLLNLAFCI
jgi:hypothetical protein